MSIKLTVTLVLGVFLLSATATLITDAKESSKIVILQNSMIGGIESLSPGLSYNPESHDFGDKHEGEVDNTTFEIWNSGCCTLTYYLIEDCSWVDVNPTFGYSIGENDTMTVTINTNGLVYGHYSYDILITSNAGDGNFTVTVNITENSNNPPNTLAITGPTGGKAGTPYNYNFVSKDPDGDDVSYYIDWGDGSTTSWTTFQSSGSPGYSENYTWSTEDTYIIRAKAKDTHGAESDWGTFTVSMPKNKLSTNLLFLHFLEKPIQNFPLIARLLLPIFEKLTGLQ